MASFKYLIFIALAVYSVAAEEGVRAKKHAYIAAAPAPILGYSASAPGSFSYAYSDYTSYPYNYAVKAAAYPAPAVYPAATYPAATVYAAPAYPSYHEDDGKYWPGKYEKTYIPAYKAAYPSYPEDDGKYWPGKYEKTYIPAYKAGYPVAYHY
ncbi:adhesive plaque matrix protein-like [Melanaphis sacchari]|uniref:adhesive plaque matrix protein-like n=1 Tax=Melanaphis sacchari TaxID=742174 RepID=UPI000DC136DF|nr:adhesive plaque matrix protein-like [Melanaphis sacchari]